MLQTSEGDIVIDLLVDEAPELCRSFLKLAKVYFYHNCIIDTVEKDFILTTGDPRQDGGTSIHGLYDRSKRWLPDEIDEKRKHVKRGLVGSANTKTNQNGSKFYITLRDEVTYLDGKHTIFGEVAEGLDILAKINTAVCDLDHHPLQTMRIRKVEILDDEMPDPTWLSKIMPKEEPAPIIDEVFKNPEDEEDEEALRERIAKAEAKSRAVSLQLLGDLPDADIVAPENVMFVAQLHPVTQDSDLELIFSRFGTIKCCEIIRDWKTGDSLQYAFIEFETQEAVNEAYLKMQGVLIDDRRIFVDFSQSVSKQWNMFRRNGARATAEDAAEIMSKTGGKGKGKGKGKGSAKGKGDANGKGSQARPDAGGRAPDRRDTERASAAPADHKGRSRSRSRGAAAASRSQTDRQGEARGHRSRDRDTSTRDRQDDKRRARSRDRGADRRTESHRPRRSRSRERRR